MKLKKAIEILECHNKWRRGADMPISNQKQLGKAIDKIIKKLTK